jgi:hypothetical protein
LQQAEAAFSSPHSLGIEVNNDMILSAFQVLGTVVSGGKFQVLLGWQALRVLPPDADYTFLVQLQDNRSHIWAESDGNGYPPAYWQPGLQGLQLLVLRLPGDLPPRAYHLTVQIVDRRQGQALPTTTGESVIPLTSLTGQLAKTPRIIDPASLPNPTSTSPAEGPGGEIALRGYDVKNANVHRGEPLNLTLHWKVLQPPSHNYRLRFFLVNERVQVVYRWPALDPIDGEWPTGQWPTDYWVQDRLSLPVGADIPSGQFSLHVEWIAENTEQPQTILPEEAVTGFELGMVTFAP